MTYDKLSPEAIAEQLTTTPGWAVIEGALSRRFEFSNYAAGILFANAVAAAAEKLNHHPDMHVGYGKVTVSMVTHDAGGGLTAFDFELARRVSSLVD